MSLQKDIVSYVIYKKTQKLQKFKALSIWFCCCNSIIGNTTLFDLIDIMQYILHFNYNSNITWTLYLKFNFHRLCRNSRHCMCKS